MTLPATNLDLQAAASIGGLVLGCAGFVVALFAILSTSRIARIDRVGVNSWEIYRAYNSAPVRAGRDIAQRILNDTGGTGLPTYDDYKRYFGTVFSTSSDGNVAPSPRSSALAEPGTRSVSAERQHLHDLAAFYHQTGTLLARGQLDPDFTLTLVGPGLEDRWPVLRPMASYYERPGASPGDYPYGGMYLLYLEYQRWKPRQFNSLRREFSRARAELQR
jgi:hypothetical protein